MSHVLMMASYGLEIVECGGAINRALAGGDTVSAAVLMCREDSKAQVDLNVVGNGDGHIIEIQGTAEGAPMLRTELDGLIDLGVEGVTQLVKLQVEAMRAAGVKLEALLGG